MEFDSSSLDIIPVSPEEITPAYLTNAMHASGYLTGGSVRHLEVLARIDTGLTSQIARLGLAYEDAPPGAPLTIIAKLSSASPEIREEVNRLGFYEREARFYHLCAGKTPLRSPRCYASAYDPAGGRSCLLLEDLTGYVQYSSASSLSEEQAVLLVNMLARLHAAWWQHPDLDGYGWLFRFNNPVGQAFRQENVNRWPALCGLFPASCRGRPVTLDAVAARLDGSWPAGLACLDEPPLTLAHGDYFLNNIFFPSGGGEPVVADFQLVSHTRGPVDLGYFLGTSLDTQTRRTLEPRLFEAYYTSLIEGGVTGYSFAEMLDDCRRGFLLTLFRYAHLAGFGPPGDPAGFKKSIRRFCDAVEDHQAWELLDRR